MSLAPGQNLLHYRLLDKIGEGGMGVVWKALDTTLDREVAIKVLPEAFAIDADRLARFEREAKLLASLSHSNIAAVHGLHRTGTVHFLAMELVEGEDLGQRLSRGPLPVDEALDLGRQIAEGLEAAHERGVIHRDLKPANVKRTPDGKIKVLDFGLAKALESDAGGSGAGFSTSPTITSAQTRDGVILGTAAYMSPEQARGKPVDRRADIWAFGCLLFEALTGKVAFAAETVSDTLVAVLSGEPEWSALPAATPPRVRRLLERCLTRDERRRLRDIGEARIALEGTIAGETEAAEDPSAAPARSPARIVLLAALGALLFAAGWFLSPAERAGGGGLDAGISIRRLTFGAGLEFEPALSPDGNLVAYTTDRAGNLDIELMPLAGGNVNPVVTHPADDAQPRWSPDGAWLAFVSARDRPGGLLTPVGGLGVFSPYVMAGDADIFLMPALGGPATKLIDRGAYPSWSPDGRDLAFQSNRDGLWRIWRVAASGGEPRRLSAGDDERVFEFQPAWSPDGRWIAYGAFDDGRASLRVVPADGGEPIVVYVGATVDPAWSPDGGSLYFSSNRTAAPGALNLWRVGIGKDGRAVSEPQRVTLAEGSDIGSSLSAGGDRLVFASVKFAPDIWALEPASGTLRQVTTTDGGEDYPHLNPDGRRLLFESDRTGDWRLWSLDLVDGTLQQLVSPSGAQFARWSPDGSRVAYALEHPDGPQLAVQRWGDVSPTILTRQPGGPATAVQWSPDGRRLVANGISDLHLYTLDGETTQLADVGAFPTWSPDGREIAFQVEIDSARREIWALPAAGGETRVLAGGDVHYSHPQWCPTDGDRILVVIDHHDLGILHVGRGEVERITDLKSSTALVDYPSWSADGRTIYFSLAQKRGDVFLVERAGG